MSGMNLLHRLCIYISKILFGLILVLSSINKNALEDSIEESIQEIKLKQTRIQEQVVLVLYSCLLLCLV